MALVQRIGHGDNTVAASPVTLSVTASTTAGNSVILAVTAGGKQVTGVTDSKGNTWTVDQASPNTTGRVSSVASTVQNVGALVSGDTITITLSAAQTAAFAAYEVAGIIVPKVVDAANQANTISNVASLSAAVTTTHAADYIFTACSIGTTGVTITQPTGFTVQATAEISNATGTSLQCADDVVAATGTYTANWSWTGATSNASVVIAAYTYSPPATSTPRRSGLLSWFRT